MLVDIQKLSKSFFAQEIETRALQDITLQIDRGEFVAIEGPSGCGKSTLLSLLGLLDSSTSGTYRLDGHLVENLNSTERAAIRNREIGFIFQNFNLIGDLTIEKNIDLPLRYRGITKAERASRIAEVLHRVSMSHRSKHYPMQLSGGEQQRVAVARALAGDPSLLLADEPTGSLDTRNGEDVMELLDQLNTSGSTIVMVTHDNRFARHAKRIVSLLDGKLQALNIHETMTA